MPYKTGSPSEVLNLYEWLPTDGEDRIGFHSDGPDVVLQVQFETDIGLAVRELRFSHACAFHIEAMPGVRGIDLISPSKNLSIGSLIEYGNSEWADAWTLHFGRPGYQPKFHHYEILFLAENKAVSVVAESFSLGDIVGCGAA
jgi:hypothetical protein